MQILLTEEELAELRKDHNRVRVLELIHEQDEKTIKELMSKVDALRSDLQDANRRNRSRVVNIGTYDKPMADVVMSKLKAVRQNPNLTTAKIVEVRRKGRGRRVFTNGDRTDRYHQGLPLSLAQEVAIYVKLEE